MQIMMLVVLLALIGTFGLGCAAGGHDRTDASDVANAEATDAPPPAIRAWMDRLTVAHDYDPETGFIVAREVVTLPPLLANGPSLDAAIDRAQSDQLVIAFATADRCAPCQQFKKDALNDPAVVRRLARPEFVATHVEVDRKPELAAAWLGGPAIPMSYALRDGEVIATLRGQRSASDLMAWLDELSLTDHS